MHRSCRSVALRIALLGLLLPHLTGCFTTEQLEPGAHVKPAKIIGMTTKAGDSVAFHPAGVRYSHDTLYATSERGPIAIPTDSVRTVWVQKYSSGKTVTLIVIGVVVTVGLLVIAGHSSSSGYGGGNQQ